MDPLTLFLNYAADFERSYISDDWNLIRGHFHDDATYTIESPTMGCELKGFETITVGIKKSLDNFDRKFDSREIIPGDDLKLTDNGLTISWSARYTKQDLPVYILKGKSNVNFEGEKIISLSDSFDAQTEKELAQWIEKTGYAVDPSYI